MEEACARSLEVGGYTLTGRAAEMETEFAALNEALGFPHDPPTSDQL